MQDGQLRKIGSRLATREDPALPLARLRARGDLTELRLAELRFTPSEAAEFLNQGMGLPLSAAEVAALAARTEGWIAGLQMAAISLTGRNDTAGFLHSFTGSHRFILDYLLEEVLQRQSERVRSFLFQTSGLQRLSASLCNAVTGNDDGQELLAMLERGNMLIVSLDDQRQWYRFHQLFAEVLQTYARAAHPDQVPVWHRRASAWYEQHGFRSEAIRHALAAQDVERAADLVEQSWPVILNGQMNNGEKLKILVFGATGTTGSAVVERALERGYAVTAFVRNPAKNVPLNNKLQALNIDTVNETAHRAARNDFEARWNQWNGIRTVFATLASTLLNILLFIL